MLSYLAEVIARAPIDSAFNWGMKFFIGSTHGSQVLGLSAEVRLRESLLLEMNSWSFVYVDRAND